MQVTPLIGYQAGTLSTFGAGVNVWFGGDLYNILDFKEEYIDLNRIAKSLARIRRYAGHTNLSVAQHSYQMTMAYILAGDLEKAWQAWGHDHSEAYLGDIVGPLKKLLMPILGPIEENIERVCAAHFGYKFPFDKDVMVMDKNSAQMEMTMMAFEDETASDYFWSEELAAKRYVEIYNLLKRLTFYKEQAQNDSNK